ncbi:phosphatidylethanolamine-binding protein 4 isoform X4 [Pangasianodon hypophthalmus]|uniref:phosphatidylethanolamine-binding protein 4 isoform X4 n=1 Tax=Pangasianodon hypophthalmus TaxID=310915 RepID=UPI0023080F8C|nr:phosphatidylethanolamine-binding protein 4 isoform X4 [Pangasianodon hypophthalmus]
MLSRAFMLLLVACIQRTCQNNSEPLTAELPLTKEDQRFCSGELELNYPDVDIRSCMIIPQEFREKISREWGPPQVRLATANTKKYMLMMVDPDAPSRTNPARAHWRHWLLADIESTLVLHLLSTLAFTVTSSFCTSSPQARCCLLANRNRAHWETGILHPLWRSLDLLVRSHRSSSLLSTLKIR